MSRYVRVIMGHCANPTDPRFDAYQPIRETLSEAVTVNDAIAACDARFDTWLNGRDPAAIGGRFMVMQAAPWDVAS